MMDHRVAHLTDILSDIAGMDNCEYIQTAIENELNDIAHEYSASRCSRIRG